jgi:hypothetical protein
MTQRIRSASPTGARCIDTSMYFFHFSFYISVSVLCEQFAAFCLFMGTPPKNCGLLGENGNTLKIKTTAKLKDKRTSLATVRGLYRANTECMPPSRPLLVLITDYLYCVLSWTTAFSDIDNEQFNNETDTFFE